MPPRKPRRMAANVDVDVISFAPIPGSLEWIHCPTCDGPSSLSQPDAQSPDRFVGFCEACREWYLILVDPAATKATIVVLPESEWFKALWNTQEFATIPNPK